MEKDSRIKLYQNEEFKGILYTKTKGVLNANGKYIMILNNNELYAQNNSFSLLYEEAKKNNLDILGFSSMISENEDIINKNLNLNNYFDTDIVFQPNISRILCYNISQPCSEMVTAGGTVDRFLQYLSAFRAVPEGERNGREYKYVTEVTYGTVYHTGRQSVGR